MKLGKRQHHILSQLTLLKPGNPGHITSGHHLNACERLSELGLVVEREQAKRWNARTCRWYFVRTFEATEAGRAYIAERGRV